MLKRLQLDSIHFLIAKQTIAHSCNSALICQFHILSKRLTPTLTPSVCLNCKLCLCIILLWYKPPLFADVQIHSKESLFAGYYVFTKLWERYLLYKVQYWLRCGIVCSYYKVSRIDWINFLYSKLIRVKHFRNIIRMIWSNSKFIFIRVYTRAR